MATSSPTKQPTGPVVVRKIAVMGYPCVGKSSLTLRFVQGHFPEAYNTTIEDMHTKNYTFKNRHYNLKITDTAGQQEYSVFPHSCSVGIDGYVLVYAIDDDYSFKMIETIHDKILESVGDAVPMLIVGNKLDLNSRRRIPKKTGEDLALQWKAPFIEISAKETEKVAQVFDTILNEIEKSRGNLPNERNSKCVIC